MQRRGLKAARHPPRQAAAQQDQEERRTGPEHGGDDVLQGRAVGPAVDEPVGIAIVGPDDDHSDSPRNKQDAPGDDRDASPAPASKEDRQCQRCEENPRDVRMLGACSSAPLPLSAAGFLTWQPWWHEATRHRRADRRRARRELGHRVLPVGEPSTPSATGSSHQLTPPERRRMPPKRRASARVTWIATALKRPLSSSSRTPAMTDVRNGRTFREIVEGERGRLGHPGDGCLELSRYGQ